MVVEILTQANAAHIDLFDLISTASRLGALRGAEIDPGRMQEVLDACKETAVHGMITDADEPEIFDAKNVIEFARPMGAPVSTSEWDAKKRWYETTLNVRLPKSEDILEQYKTWEKFWEAAGFEVEDYTPAEIIDRTLGTKKSGFFTINECDAGFPDIPSSSLVKYRFGGDWKKYSTATRKAREKRKMPGIRIEQLLRQGKKVKEVEHAVVSEFADKPGVPDLYKRPSNDLYMQISVRKKEIDSDEAVNVLSRTAIGSDYSTIDDIANKQIKDFKLYSGARKAEKREMIAEDVFEHLVRKDGPGKFRYLGLEGANFKSYIYLQQMLDGNIDPSASLVAESKQDVAASMQSIVDNHDLIDGGEIFDGLTVAPQLIHHAVNECTDMEFDIINLDFMGGWSMSKERTLDYLFRNGQIADHTLMYITLLNSETEKYRVKNGSDSSGIRRKGYYTDDQKALLETKIKRLCDMHGFDFKKLHCDEYFDTQKMLFFGFYLEKNRKGD